MHLDTLRRRRMGRAQFKKKEHFCVPSFSLFIFDNHIRYLVSACIYYV